MKICAIIPARGGSKRIPFKNLIDFAGKPMIAWTIEAAIKSEIFDDIYISTDDEAISNYCFNNYKVKIVKRECCNDDHSTVSDATFQTLKQLREVGKTYDIVIQLMANCPLKTSDDILNAYYNFMTSENDYQISVFKYGFMNPYWAMNKNGIPLFPNEIKMRSQDLEKLFCPTGAIWIANVKKFMETKNFYSNGYGIFEIDCINAIDIDDYNDLEFAKLASKYLLKNE